jgi:hypothetical protein
MSGQGIRDKPTSGTAAVRCYCMVPARVRSGGGGEGFVQQVSTWGHICPTPLKGTLISERPKREVTPADS